MADDDFFECIKAENEFVEVIVINKGCQISMREAIQKSIHALEEKMIK